MMFKNQVNKVVALVERDRDRERDKRERKGQREMETEPEHAPKTTVDEIRKMLRKTAKVFNSIFSGILLSNFSFARHLLNIYAIMMCLNL